MRLPAESAGPPHHPQGDTEFSGQCLGQWMPWKGLAWRTAAHCRRKATRGPPDSPRTADASLWPLAGGRYRNATQSPHLWQL